MNALAADRAEAARLFAEGKAAMAAKDYRHALDCYRRSLTLVDDPEVGEALQHLMAVIGPM
jgi:tetratricopeptide (TPR) repeat protein